MKAAIAWARANVDKFGGDRNFIAVAGCSAGGHLSALAGLTANDPDYQSELPEGSDTSVDAAVGIYGRYDWEDRSTAERARFVDFLERVVVKRSIKRHPQVFRDASPVARVHTNAPPFLVIHGSRDGVIPVAQARSFVERLRAVSRSLVAYVELPGPATASTCWTGPHRLGHARDFVVPQPDSSHSGAAVERGHLTRRSTVRSRHD
ncbi:alpha/beta hydrolase fold family protein [Mycobacterium ulcerans str. Harvey]|uniref:Alpha/beta hydrolase fold family protein n=1 Tax=Mycobacterium ulcerans str. Harvey TaxID=1299332 RepID=A0ABP3AP47_MYCUL|nr:alpha/beta hydrolase fold family protein [Mycobacterium ulcerans str. Harvey]